jgi:hypothetical protein
MLALLAMVTAVGLGILDVGAILFHNQDLGRPVPDAFAVASGAESRQGYLVRHVSNERAVLALQGHAPAGARVLFVWNDRVFWAGPGAIPEQPGGTLPLLLAADARARRTHAPFHLPFGATYLLVSHETAVYYRANGWALDPATIAGYAALDDLAARRLILLYKDPSFAVYATRPVTGGRPSPASRRL